MIPSYLLPIANHLWQSTLFAGIAGLLILLLRNNRAHTRYCLWLAASVKFLIPVSLLVFAGGQFARPTAMAPAPSTLPLIIEQVREPFVADVSLQPRPTSRPHSPSLFVPILAALWAAGFGILVISWWMRWRRIHRVFREASPVPLGIGVPVRSSASFLEPGVFGVWRPVLLLPDGLRDHLAPAELQAILAHELCHVRRRDNLATVLHMVVEAVFWFHPLVWWLGARLMEERERACDEEVLRTGSEPETYAEGMLKVCELYVRSPLESVAGVTGANLKKRIEAIMNNGPTFELNFAKKAALAIAGILAVAIPVILGVMNVPALRAQAQADQRFEVASIRRAEIPANPNGVPVFPTTGGVGTSSPLRITYRGTWLFSLIAEAFGVRADQITGPEWVNKDRWDIVANIPEGATKEQFKIMLGNLLQDRFHLRFHMGSKDRPVYVLRVGKNGPKFKETARVADDATPAKAGAPDASGFPVLSPNYKGSVGMPGPDGMFLVGQDVPLTQIAGWFEGKAGRPIVDETGLTGRYDVKIHFEWMSRRPATAPSSAPSVFTAVEEQLGLKLESATRSFPQFIIDSIDREPTEN